MSTASPATPSRFASNDLPEVAGDMLEEALCGFEETLSRGQQISDAALFEFINEITRYINVMEPIPTREELSGEWGPREDLIAKTNARILQGRQANFQHRFQFFYAMIASLPDTERQAAIDEQSAQLLSFQAEAHILGLRREINLQLLELQTSALVVRPVDPYFLSQK